MASTSALRGLRDELDVTPAYTFSTIQFSNEVLNAVVGSLITVFILVNIGSVVSKVINRTRTSVFRYSCWLRAYIFANSDDPLRILSWLSRRYVYRNPSWQRYPNRLRYSRLVLPLLARFFIFVVSIVSVAVTIPDVRRMVGCVDNDYKVALDPSRANRSEESLPVFCVDIPLKTDRGEVDSTAAYCYCIDSFVQNPTDVPPGQSRVTIESNPDQATIRTEVETPDEKSSYSFYLEWRGSDASQFGDTFRSSLHDTLGRDAHAKLVHELFVQPAPDQTTAPCSSITSPIAVSNTTYQFSLGCNLPTTDAVAAIERYTRSALVWRQESPGLVAPRIKLLRDEATGAEDPSCPLDIKISRPIVNIVPLALMLVAWVVVNSLVSFFTRNHGHALDAGFHIIKEALGHDTTSNPLENCVERQEVCRVPLRKWACANGGAHFGFIGREGDVPVTEFTEKTVVSGCSRVAIELDRAAALVDAPVGFAPPGARETNPATPP